MEPLTPIPEETALKIWRGRDQLDPAEVADVLERYSKQQEDNGDDLWPSMRRQQEEAKGQLNSMFMGGIDNVPADISPFVEDQRSAKAMHAGMAFLSNRLNLPAQKIAERPEFYMNGYASQKWGMAEADPVAFYEGAAKEITKEKQDEEISKAGYAAALRGEPISQSLATFQVKNAGDWQDMLRASSLFTRSYMRGQEFAGEKLPMAKELLGILESDWNVTKGEEARPNKSGREQSARLTEIVQDMATMTKGERRKVYASIGAQIEASGNDQKGFWAQMLGNLGRNVSGMGERVNTKAIEAGVVAQSSPMTIAPEFDFQVQEQTPEQKRDMEAAIKLNDNMGLVRDEIAQIVSGQLDPIKPTVGWLNDDLEKGLIQGPGAVAPYMMATAALGPWGAGIIATADFSEQNRLSLIQQGMDPQAAKRIGAMAAPAQAAVESLSNMLQLGRFPAVQKALAGLTKPIAGGAGMLTRYGLNSGVSLATEFTEEQLQDNVIVPMAQNVAAAFDSDVPQVGMGEIWNNIKKSSPDLFFTLAPMALVFGGVMTSAQAKLSEQMMTIDGLKALNFSQAQATAVVSEPTIEAKVSKARELWGVRAGTPVTLNEAAKRLSETMRKLSVDAVASQQELEQRGILPRMLHTAQDSWRLTFNDGSVTDFATHAEADQSRWAWASDQLGKFHAVTRQALVSLEKNLEQNREIAPIYSPDAKVITKADAAADPALQERLAQAENLGDIEQAREDTLSIGRATGTNDDVLAQILGQSTNSFKDGILTTTIKLYEGSNVLTLVEEKLEGDAKVLMSKPQSRAWMLAHLQAYEKESGDKLFHSEDISDQALTEAWSHLGQSYLVGRSTYGDPLQGGAFRRFLKYIMQSGLSGAMNAQSEYWRAVATRAQKVNELRQAGKLGDDLVTELERQLGINGSQARHEAGTIQEAASMVDEAGIPASSNETYSIRKGDFDSRLAAMFSPFQKSPQLRMQIAQVAKQRAQKLGAEWIEKAAQIRSAASIEREAKTREALKTAELMQAGADEKDARKQAKADAAAWAGEARKKAGSPKAQRENLQGALRTLDAILSAAPPEVRAKVGGYVKLAGLATDEAMLKEIERRVEKLNVELEKWLKKEGIAQIEKLFRKAGPKAEAGKKAKGKDADMHHLFSVAEAAAEWSAVEVAGKLADLDARIASGELTPEQEILATTERGLIELVGDLKNADSGRVHSALATLEEIYQGGWLAWKLKEIEKRELRAGARHAMISDTGKSGIQPERDAADEEAKGLFGRGMKQLLSISSLHQELGYYFGQDSERVLSLVDAEREASNQYEDANQALADEIEKLFSQMAGGSVMKGERLRYDLAQKSIKTSKANLSQLEAITAILMHSQEQGRKHMEGLRNEAGEVISKWHYNDAWIAEVQGQLTPEAQKVLAWIRAMYAVEYASINPLYRERYGVNMPHHDNYAPLTVAPQQLKTGEVNDPITGAAMPSGSVLTPSSMRTRSNSAVARPIFKDALQVFIAHKRQIEYWRSHYDLATEMSAILGNREVMDAVYAVGGEKAVNALKLRIDATATGGFRDSASALASNDLIRKASNNAASMALVGRVSTILVQSTQLAAASVKMPLVDYMTRFVKLMSGNLKWKDAIKSDFIQRRYKSAPPLVRQAMEHLSNQSKPNLIKHAVAQLGKLLSGADALFTGGTYAILLDYHRSTGAAMGMSGAELETYARTEAERATEEVAQPVRMNTRSLAEITTTQPLAKTIWSFSSESRQKLALLAWATSRSLNSKEDAAHFAKTAVLVFGVGGLLTQVIKNLWREAKGDDDEKKWQPMSLVQSSVAQAFHGFPGFSEFSGERGLLSGGVQARYALEDFGKGEGDLKDAEALFLVLGYFNDTAAGVVSLSHLGMDFAKILASLAEDD